MGFNRWKKEQLVLDVGMLEEEKKGVLSKGPNGDGQITGSKMAGLEGCYQ